MIHSRALCAPAWPPIAGLASLCLASGCPGGEALTARLPEQATVFATTQLDVAYAGELAMVAGLADDQVHDAYDADRDGNWIRLSATFTPEGDAAGEAITVPGFAMRDEPAGPWHWRVRWSPQRSGAWRVALRCEAAVGGARADVRAALPGAIRALPGEGIDGPLVAPGPDEDPSYLRHRDADGRTHATWLFGACRAWVVASDPKAPGWAPHEGLDRETELLPTLRANGYDLLNQWMAPWEYLLVHCDRAEQWRQPDGAWTRVPIAAGAAWRPWACFDQGRAAAFDRLVTACEGGPGKTAVRLLLSPLPHQCLQMRSHAWGRTESGWSPTDDAGASSSEKLNGFSVFPHVEDAWAFFAGDPRAAADDPRSQLFDAQADLMRYLVARWGSSRALGLWVLIDELDGVGDEHGIMAAGTGWWGHPQCARWLADMTRLMRGSLTRADGMAYAGDPFHHPLHAATTSIGTGFLPGGNVEWDGGAIPDARPDVVGWHWYPSWPDGSTWRDAWSYVIDGIAVFSSRPSPQARLISEFGAADRSRPTDVPSALYPTLYHHGIWAAVFTGECGTVMDWDDGKEFGELTWRAAPGVFDHEHYPVDNAAQVRALRRFLRPLDPDLLRRALPAGVAGAGPFVTGADGVRALALATRGAAPALHGWAYSASGAGGIVIKDLDPGRYRLAWTDPWSGDAAPLEPATVTVTVDASRTLNIDLKPVLGSLAPAQSFPRATREDRGHDVAFRLVPITP